MTKPYYFSFEHVHQLVKKTAEKIQQDNFVPDYILAIGAGGFVPARILRNFIKVPILVITVTSYDDDEHRQTGQMQKTQWLAPNMLRDKKVLVVDDIDDSRATLAFCFQELIKEQAAELRLFVLHHKDREKMGTYPESLKHIYIGESLKDEWIYYPWEITDMAAFNAAVKENSKK